MTHPDPVQAIGDELAIRDLVNRYADATTRRDARGVADTFTANGEWTAAGLGTVRGQDEMVPRFAELQSPFGAFLQTLLSGRVRLDSDDRDRATGRWYVMEIGRMTDDTHIQMWGVYHDVYVRTAEGWLLSTRRFDPLFLRRGDGLDSFPFPADAPDLVSR